MGKKKKPAEEKKLKDYREAAENSLELAKVLAGKAASAIRTFLNAWRVATGWWTMTAKPAVCATISSWAPW